MALILDGKAVALAVKDEVRVDILKIKSKGFIPGLAVILVGEDPGSKVYVGGKVKDCAETGIRSFEHRLPATTSQAELEDLIQKLNKDPQVHGLLV